jgi:diadenosine tetraphosphate (Ap4A) HIT family hydrolase
MAHAAQPAEPFRLDARLAAECTDLADLPLCRVLLMEDARFPWLVLAPRRAGITEIHQLSSADQAQLMAEIVRASAALQRQTGCDKLNVAALGNMVPQLHVHVIARRHGDPAWPRPVWGVGDAVRYAASARASLMEAMRAALNEP